MSEKAPLDTVYTADEAAARIRISKRAVIKLGRDIGACSRSKRDYLFSEQDILDIWQAMRSPPISYHGRAVHIPARETMAALSRRAQELLGQKKGDPAREAERKKQQLARARLEKVIERNQS